MTTVKELITYLQKMDENAKVFAIYRGNICDLDVNEGIVCYNNGYLFDSE